MLQKVSAIFTITDAYIKNLQDRRISNYGDLDGKITIDSNTIVEKWLVITITMVSKSKRYRRMRIMMLK